MKQLPILITAACALVLSPITRAQTPAPPPAAAVGADPALAALSGKYDADIVAINKSRDEALVANRPTYLAALSAAEQKATTAGKLDVMKAILEEKEAINTGGTLTPVPNAALPHDLAAVRSNYLREAARLTATTAPRLATLQSTYLQALGSLEQRASTMRNTALATQIEQEKMRLIGRATLVAGAKGVIVAVPKGKNVVVNGDFSQVDAEGKLVGWGNLNKATSIQTENGNNFVRYTTDKANAWAPFIGQRNIQIPPNAKKVTLSARLRTNDFKISDKPWDVVGVGILASTYDESGKRLGNPTVAVGTRIEKTWKTHKATADLPQGATRIQLDVVLGSATGTMDVDDIEIEFK